MRLDELASIRRGVKYRVSEANSTLDDFNLTIEESIVSICFRFGSASTGFACWLLAWFVVVVLVVVEFEMAVAAGFDCGFDVCDLVDGVPDEELFVCCSLGFVVVGFELDLLDGTGKDDCVLPEFSTDLDEAKVVEELAGSLDVATAGFGCGVDGLDTLASTFSGLFSIKQV